MNRSSSHVVIHWLPGWEQIELVEYDSRQQSIIRQGSIRIGQFLCEKSTSLSTNGLPHPAHPDTPWDYSFTQQGLKKALKILYRQTKILTHQPVTLVIHPSVSKTLTITEGLSDSEKQLIVEKDLQRHLGSASSAMVTYAVQARANTLFYAALPQAVINLWISTLEVLDIPLLAIETNYGALAKALPMTGAIQFLDDQSPLQWAVLLLIEDRIGVVHLENNQWVRVEEFLYPWNPVSGNDISQVSDNARLLMASSTQSLYQDEYQLLQLKNKLDRWLGNQALDQVVIINHTPLAGPEQLVQGWDIQHPVMVIPQLPATIQSLADTLLNPASIQNDFDFPCTLEAIGGVFYNHFDSDQSFNLLPQSAQWEAGSNHHAMESLKYSVLRWASAVMVVTIVLVVLASSGLGIIQWQQSLTLQQLRRHTLMQTDSRMNDFHPATPWTLWTLTAAQQLEVPLSIRSPQRAF